MRNLATILLMLGLSADAYTASRGALSTEVDEIGDTLRIEVLPPIDQRKAAELVTWLQSVSADMRLAYGRFPGKSPRIVVIPSESSSWGADSPVPFGRLMRRGKDKIELYVNADRPIEDFYGDWTATHEFSHLMLPYVGDRYRWISEGFASYYQNVLMARAGRYTAEQAWQKLYAGLERGRVSRPDLTLNEAAVAGVRQARMKIYWSGAAIALLADVELRERSGGRESLDTALDRLERCCLPATRTWSGPELFQQLDTLVGHEVLMPLYRRYADQNGFPDVRPALQRLGVGTNRDRVSLLRTAELEHIRESITARREL